MKNDKEQIGRSEAIDALNLIETMRGASLKRALSPRWYSATLAILAGTVVFLAAANLREYQVLVILMIGLVIIYQVQKSGVATKAVPIKHVIVTIVLLLPLYFLLVFTGQYLMPVLGELLAPLLAGALLAIFVYILSMIERQKVNSAIDSDHKQ